MNNYQLYRTNVLLGGQLKWDIIINNSQNTLYVADFHLSPISDNTPYTYKSDEYLVKNSHQDNIKTFYKQTKGYFYSECIDSVFSHNWPIICNPGETIDAYSNTYDAGCRRSKHFNEYKKQFEFLCPLWLEHINDDITFIISIKDTVSNTVLASNALILSLKDLHYSYHNSFVNYLNNYLNDAELISGNDNVLNIMLKDNKATITGLNTTNGLFETRSIHNLVDNITSRERPMMEFDNMLIQSFVNNSMICKQLFNFNLCFNIDDIMSGSIINMLYGEDIIVSVDVKIGDNVLEKRNFYTEYEHIQKYVKSDMEFDANVLDYLHDNHYIKFVDKNKFCQSICHWSLNDNPNYLFNLYDGFSGLYIEPDASGGYNIYENEHQYCNAPDTIVKKYDKNKNNCGWFTVLDIGNKWDEFYKFIKNPEKNKTKGTFIGDSHFINNVKYRYIPKINDGIYLLGLFMDSRLLSSITSTFENDCTEIISNSMYILVNDDVVLILTNNIDNLTFGGFFDVLFNFVQHDSSSSNVYDNITNTHIKNVIDGLYKMMASKVEPSIIVFDKSLTFNTANGPDDIAEIDYYKDDNFYNYVIRYDGKIKPSFVNNCNSLYYKDYGSNGDISRLKNSIYTKYKSNEYEPIYPSIDYCAIKRIDSWSYDALPLIQVLEHDDKVAPYRTTFEYKWFNISKCLILSPEIKVTYKCKRNDDGTYKSLDDIINECLTTYYNTTNTEFIEYIKTLYTYTNKWEYASETNIDDYIYNIVITLK